MVLTCSYYTIAEKLNPHCQLPKVDGKSCARYPACLFFHKEVDCIHYYRDQKCGNGSRCPKNHRAGASYQKLQERIIAANRPPPTQVLTTFGQWRTKRRRKLASVWQYQT